ncbi:uncharacterized protein PADG_12398 [Paracoccidioides brasiliensis Pb18]|uniref:Uncharacterized protein n=1 Tax=Paracoccidioides brasiliensis (strain Pb18) TaxID=502780 RepID=A0A0A0HVS1_PARBD|nr:uncharacterized protein PADG_12398 [Paracoccidioides brasiliensis Pb18]KGM91540.1 hypothetical protein PADG_12398 [Paracoccidioides brasiliensis Pb18]
MRDTDAIHDESYQEEQCEGQRQKKKVNHQRTKGTAIETVLWNLERVDLMEIVEDPGAGGQCRGLRGKEGEILYSFAVSIPPGEPVLGVLADYANIAV